MDKPKGVNEELLKKMGGINITINLGGESDCKDCEKMDCAHCEMKKEARGENKTKKLETINQEMLKIMKKEKTPVFEPTKELKAEKYI